MTMKNGDMPAMPIAGAAIDVDESLDDATAGGRFIPINGLTKREMMAMHMMAHLMPIESFASYEDQASCAIKAVDALLAELESTK